ncbi:MAG: hypothetical protein MUF49_20745 [Oculatellaceae cyanobacterium Prado106]|nr:hypothetical protein [Oculatellaceae cyanobacterium Prado106]
MFDGGLEEEIEIQTENELNRIALGRLQPPDAICFIFQSLQVPALLKAHNGSPDFIDMWPGIYFVLNFNSKSFATPDFLLTLRAEQSRFKRGSRARI